MTTKYTDAPRTRVMTPAALNNGVHENHSIGQTMAIAPKKGLFDDISIPQIIAGAAAAATSVALASKIGIAGSVIGAAVSSVITVVSSQVYRHFISASAKALKGTHADVDYPAGAYEPVELNAEEHLGGAATTQEMRQIAGRATTARVAPTACAPRRRQSAARRKRRSSSSRSPSPSSRSLPAPAPSLSPPPVRVWVSVPSQSFRRARPSTTRIAPINRKASRTTRRAPLHPPTRHRTPPINRRASIPLRQTAARNPARLTQAKRLTARSRARATRRAAIHRVRDLPTTATPTARAEPRPARHLTARAKARHRATRSFASHGEPTCITGANRQRSRPFALGDEMASPVRW